MGNLRMRADQISYKGGETPMSVEEVLRNTSSEAAAIAHLQTEVATLNSTKANQITIAPFFSADASYDPGDLVYYNGLSYRCVNTHEGEWDADDFAATTIANEIGELKSGLTNIGDKINLGNVQGSGTITLSEAVTNFRFVLILIGYYASGYPCFGQALLPVSTIPITADDIPVTVAFSDRTGTTSGKADISFLSATSVKVVNTSDAVYTRFVGIA